MDRISPYTPDFIDVIDKYVQSHSISGWDGSYKIPAPVLIPYQWLIYWAFCKEEKYKISIWSIANERKKTSDSRIMLINIKPNRIVIKYENNSNKYRLIYDFKRQLISALENVATMCDEINLHYQNIKFSNKYNEPQSLLSPLDSLNILTHSFSSRINEHFIIREYCDKVFNNAIRDIHFVLNMHELQPQLFEIYCYIKNDFVNVNLINTQIICDTIPFIHSSTIFIHGISAVHRSYSVISASIFFNEIFYTEDGNGYYLAKLNNIQHYSREELNQWITQWSIESNNNIYNSLRIKLSKRRWDNENKDYIFDDELNSL